MEKRLLWSCNAVCTAQQHAATECDMTVPTRSKLHDGTAPQRRGIEAVGIRLADGHAEQHDGAEAEATRSES
jgi:hypothetical protein